MNGGHGATCYPVRRPLSFFSALKKESEEETTPSRNRLHRTSNIPSGFCVEAGEFAYALTEQYVESIPWLVAKLLGWVWFSRLFHLRVQMRAKQSQSRRQQRDFVYEYVQGDGWRFDFGVDYHECAVWTFLKSQGAPELAPYVCALDQLYSEAFGWGLMRTTTLAEGGSLCDFRFKRGGETKIASTVLPMQRT
jgi:hypothetical protein